MGSASPRGRGALVLCRANQASNVTDPPGYEWVHLAPVVPDFEVKR